MSNSRTVHTDKAGHNVQFPLYVQIIFTNNFKTKISVFVVHFKEHWHSFPGVTEQKHENPQYNQSPGGRLERGTTRNEVRSAIDWATVFGRTLPCRWILQSSWTWCRVFWYNCSDVSGDRRWWNVKKTIITVNVFSDVCRIKPNTKTFLRAHVQIVYVGRASVGVR
jgi:hypothetical protein